MTYPAKLIKKLNFVTRTALKHLKAAKENAATAEHIIERLRDGDAIGQLRSDELAALTESATTVSRVIAGFDSVTR